MTVLEFLVLCVVVAICVPIYVWIGEHRIDQWLKDTPSFPPDPSAFYAQPEPDDPKIAALLAAERAERKRVAIEHLRSLRG